MSEMSSESWLLKSKGLLLQKFGFDSSQSTSDNIREQSHKHIIQHKATMI